MQLREWQEQLQASLLTGVSNELTLAERALSAPRGIGIYANAYSTRLCEALSSNFEALHRLLGDADFAAMARQFAAAHPPCTASIRWHGDGLADFLALAEPYRDCPAVAELARFEWALRHALDAADAERIGAATLQALSPDEWPALRCGLHPSLSILSFEWNAPAIWRALDANEEPPPPERCTRDWIVYRDAELIVNWRSVDATELELLRLWQTGATFGGLCAELETKLDEPAAAAAQFMRLWLTQGLLVQSIE